MKHIVYLSIGSNLGDRLQHLRRARILMSIHCGVLVHISQIYETAPWGETDQDEYLNQAICLHTDLSPQELMRRTQLIENRLLKKKMSRWGPRTLDIDILLYNDEHIVMETLEIPHPRMLGRNFVLIPLSEIAGEMIHPLARKPIYQLAARCHDHSLVHVYPRLSV